MSTDNSPPQSAFGVRSVAMLPEHLSIFPLPGATLLPGTQLPLNIFEPRYLNMIIDALGEGRLIGMVQPRSEHTTDEPVALHEVGCAGRIVSFSETGDGRLLIGLRGVCRFRIGEELSLRRGYRRVSALWSDFADDLQRDERSSHTIAEIKAALDEYLRVNDVRVDWKGLQAIPTQTAIDFLAMNLPLTLDEKQLMLEAGSAQERWTLLLAITQMAASSSASAATSIHPSPDGTTPTRH